MERIRELQLFILDSDDPNYYLESLSSVAL
jgi:hypothetical protein